MTDDVRTQVRSLAEAHLGRGDTLGWFDAVYAAAEGDERRIPWADLVANAALLTWLDGPHAGTVRGGRALVVGSGLGDDAEALVSHGFHVTAFDVAPRAVAWSKRRFPASRVSYEVADLFELPETFAGAFDFVFEAYTLQSLPHTVRPRALESLARTVAPRGHLLVVARTRDEGPADRVAGPPWPLARSELRALERAGLHEIAFDPYDDGTRRFAATYEHA